MGLASIFCEGDFKPRQIIPTAARLLVCSEGREERGMFVRALWRPDGVMTLHSFLEGKLEIASRSAMIDERTFFVFYTMKVLGESIRNVRCGMCSESTFDEERKSKIEYKPEAQTHILQDGVTERWLGFGVSNSSEFWGLYQDSEEAAGDFARENLNRRTHIEASRVVFCQAIGNPPSPTTFSFRLTIAVGESREEVLQRLNLWGNVPADVPVSEATVSKAWNDFFDQHKIKSSEPQLQKVHLYGLYISKANAVEAMAAKPPGITHPAILPSKVGYYGLWLWDTFFLGLPLVTTSEHGLVEGSLLTLLDNQAANGLIPIATFPTRQEPHPKALTQAPLLTMESWALFRAKKFYEGEESSLKFLQNVYAKLRDFHSFWYRERDRDGDGMCEYSHGWESGVDNSPYWDERGADCVEDILLALFLYLDCNYLGAMARTLGRAVDEEELVKEALRIEDAILNEFYDRESGLFYSRYYDTHELIKVKTFESLLPLLLDNISHDQRTSIINHVTNPNQFWAEYPVPTVAMDEPTFGSKFSGAWWRKPVWLSANWLLLKGLMKWGYYDEAKYIIDRTVQLVLKSAREESGNRRFCENFDPVSGEMPEGQVHFFGWNGLVSSMITEFLGGIQFCEPDDHLVFDPICGKPMKIRIFDWFVSTEQDRYTFGFKGSRILTADRGVRCEVMVRTDERVTIKLDSHQPHPFEIFVYGDYFKGHVQVSIEGAIKGVGGNVSWTQSQVPIFVDLRQG